MCYYTRFSGFALTCLRMNERELPKDTFYRMMTGRDSVFVINIAAFLSLWWNVGVVRAVLFLGIHARCHIKAGWAGVGGFTKYLL